MPRSRDPRAYPAWVVKLYRAMAESASKPVRFEISCESRNDALAKRHTWYAYINALTRVEELKSTKKLSELDKGMLEELRAYIEIAKSYQLGIRENVIVFEQRDSLPSNIRIAQQIDQVFGASSKEPRDNSQLPPDSIEEIDEASLVDITHERIKGPELTYDSIIGEMIKPKGDTQ